MTDSDTTGTQTVTLSGAGAGIYSAILLTATPTTAVAGTNVALTATLSGNSTNPPSGTVTFSNNGTSIGMATLANGVATLNTKALPVGSDAITASYGGDSVYPMTSTTTPVTVTITAVPVPDFTFSIANTAINLNDSYRNGSATLNVAFINGFSQTVSFSCSGLPRQQPLQLYAGNALCQRVLRVDRWHRPGSASSFPEGTVRAGRWHRSCDVVIAPAVPSPDAGQARELRARSWVYC